MLRRKFVSAARPLAHPGSWLYLLSSYGSTAPGSGLAFPLHPHNPTHQPQQRRLGSTARPPPPPACPPLEPWLHSGHAIERAATPPSSWYTSPAVLQLEERSVFQHSWQALAHSSWVAAPGAYATGNLLSLQWLVCRDEQGQLRAFHNVCRHHAAILAEGSGTATCFRCPYHGWTYGLDGRLQKALRLKGIQDFRAADNGLLPLQVEQWGGFVWVRQAGVAAARTGAAAGASEERQQGQPEQQTTAAAAAAVAAGAHGQEEEEQRRGQGAAGRRQGLATWLGQQGSQAALAAGIADDLVHVASREYVINCNWKVYCDNYLDGGYHVSVAHPELASGLDLATYSSSLYERLSIQSCQPAGKVVAAAAAAAAATEVQHRASGSSGGSNSSGGGSSDGGGNMHSQQDEETLQRPERQRRLKGGRPPAYLFVYPNTMINRYGPWLDTNIVVPLAADKCKVLFEYYLDPGLASDQAFVEESLAASHRVQLEDVALCQSVQRGLQSPAYDAGRYAPGVEAPMHHFHQLLHVDLTAR